MSDAYEYPIFLKRKKSSRKKPQRRMYKIEEPPTEDFLIGQIPLGTSTSSFPKEMHSIKAYFDTVSATGDTLNLEVDDTLLFTILLNIDTSFVIALFQSSKFYYQIIEGTDDSYIDMKVYFKSLPILNGSKQLLQAICKLFLILFDIGSDDLLNKKKQRSMDNVDQIESIYESIRLSQGASALINRQDVCTQSKWLTPKLRPYQLSAVEFMLKKENSIETKEINHPSYTPIRIASGLQVYFNSAEGYVLLEHPLVEICTNGGILADEMGLGKTIELLGLVLLDFEQTRKFKAGSIQLRKQPKRPSYAIAGTVDEEAVAQSISPKDITRQSLAQFYANNVVSVFDGKKKETTDISCICGSIEPKKLVQCISCDKKQHSNCVGYKPQYGDFKCSQCWPTEDLIPSHATLIICPSSLLQQWLMEIKKHINCNLEVLLYEGSNILTPVYPHDLAHYDIVITTYQVLHNEFNFVDQCASKSLRNQRKYSSPGVSITTVSWRRVCLDEAQTVESTTTRVAEMARRLTARYRWAITGTPVSVSISDIYGLVEYLHLEPFNDNATFTHVLYQPYLHGNDKPLVEFLASVLWRTRKRDVLEQINIPKQTTRQYYVDFTQVEQYFYDCEKRESQNVFLEKLTKYELGAPLRSLKVQDLNNLLQPVVSLRRVCVHHNVVKGRYLITKKPVNSMQELLDALIARNIGACEEHLRLMIASLNGLAGIYLLLSNPLTAAQQYLKVLELEEKFNGVGSIEKYGALSIDKLPLIHTYYNFRQLILSDENLLTNLSTMEQKTVTITGAQLQMKQELLEHEYVQKFEHQTKTALESLNALTEKIAEMEAKIKCKTWCADLVALIFSNGLKKQLNQRVNAAIENLHQSNKFISFRPNQSILIESLMSYMNDLATLREESMSEVNALYEITANNRITFTPEMIEMVANCHLRPDKSKPNKITCPFCTSHKTLLKYEKVLFNGSSENNNKQFAWQQSEKEMIIYTMLKIARVNLRKQQMLEITNDGRVFIETLTVQKKEFRELRKEWRLLEGQIASGDELDLCKVRLCFKKPEKNKTEKKTLKELSYEIKNNLAQINEINEQQVDIYRYNFQNEGIFHRSRLEKCLGTNKYLQSLHKAKTAQQELDPCPICKYHLSTSYNILTCGHAYCLNCMQTLITRECNDNFLNMRKPITCAVCRHTQALGDISCVDEALPSKDAPNQEDAVVGNCSSKVSHIVKLIKQLMREERGVKVLVFSTWPSVLKIMQNVFEENAIISELILSPSGVAKGVDRFIQKIFVTALLLPVNLGSKGLNLIHASHIIFAEPILDPAEEMQAIGRIHRFGQQRETIVHKFIMKGSIEEEIHRVTSAENNSKWNKSQVTVQQIKDLLFAADNRYPAGFEMDLDDQGHNDADIDQEDVRNHLNDDVDQEHIDNEEGNVPNVRDCSNSNANEDQSNLVNVDNEGQGSSLDHNNIVENDDDNDNMGIDELIGNSDTNNMEEDSS